MKEDSADSSLSVSCKELLHALDPNGALDQLQCIICFQSVNPTNRKPMIFCKQSICLQKHTICAACVNNMVNAKRQKDRQNGIPEAEISHLPCPNCRKPMPEYFQEDKVKLKICLSLEITLAKLKDIQINLKQISQQQYQKKMKEIVDRAETDIFKSKCEAIRKTYLFTRLKRRVQNTDKQMQKRLKEVSQQARIIDQMEEKHRIQMQSVLDKQIQLQKIVQVSSLKIKQLEQQNQKLRKQLNQYCHLDKIQTLVRRSPKRQAENIIFNFGDTYRQFKFIPMRDLSFSENFLERKPDFVIELRKQRQAYLRARPQMKQIHHRQFFSINDQNDRLICFKLIGLNPRTRRYKFGLLDKNLQQIKRACLLLDLGERHMDNKQECIIYFYINLINKKLAGSMGNVKDSWDIPIKANLQKFTIYISFTDMQTQIKFD